MWKPVHEVHAIERVRLTISLREALTKKALKSAAEPIAAAPNAYDLKETVTDQYRVDVGPDGPKVVREDNIGFRRYSGEQVAEEIIFGHSAFGYTTHTYGRWSMLAERVRSLFDQPLNHALSNTDCSSAKLEYWDRFIFDGPIAEANAFDLLDIGGFEIPTKSIGAGCFWHSHCGWFEFYLHSQYLVNRDIGVSVAERLDVPEEKKMSVTFHTLAEKRFDESDISSCQVFGVVDGAHKLANKTFGGVVKREFREVIGLTLEDING